MVPHDCASTECPAANLAFDDQSVPIRLLEDGSIMSISIKMPGYSNYTIHPLHINQTNKQLI